MIENNLIKVLVLEKRNLSPAKNGSWFSALVRDDSRITIKLKFFQEAADYFFDKIHPKAYYLIRFNRENNTKNEVYVNDKDWDLYPIKEDASTLTLTELSQIQQKSPKSTVNVAAYVREIGDLNQELQRREIFLVDHTNCEIKLTLWKDYAVSVNFNKNDLVLFKEVLISKYKSLDTNFGRAEILSNPKDLPKKHPVIEKLKKWNPEEYISKRSTFTRSQTDHSNSSQISKSKIKDILSASEGLVFDVNVTISGVKSILNNLFYSKCPNCKGKDFILNDGDNNIFECSGCKNDFKGKPHEYVLKIELKDETGSLSAVAFNKQAETILEVSSYRLKELQEENENEAEQYLRRLVGKNLNVLLSSKKSHTRETEEAVIKYVK